MLDADPIHAVGFVSNASGWIGVAPVKKVESEEDRLNLDVSFGHYDCASREGNVLGSMGGGRMMKILTKMTVLEWDG